MRSSPWRASPPAPCGATSTGLPCPDVWEFDGTSWRNRVVADPEDDGSYAQAPARSVYWPGDGGMFAPDLTSFNTGRLWRGDGGFARRPALVAEIDFSSSGAPGDAIIDRVELRATARATSELLGATSTDVALLAGEPTGWRTVDTASSGATGGVDLSYCASRSDVGPSCQAPAGTNGKGIATVWLDYAEVRVHYRLPEE